MFCEGKTDSPLVIFEVRGMVALLLRRADSHDELSDDNTSFHCSSCVADKERRS